MQKLSFRQKISQKLVNLISPQSEVLKFGRTYWFNSSGSKMIKDVSSITGQMKSYDYCAPLNGIINRKAEAFTNGKWWLLDKDGKEVTNSYAKGLMELMKNPNPLQTWAQFNIQAKVYEQLFGEAFIFGLTPAGFTYSIENVKALWVIPNWMMDVKLTGKHYMQTDIGEIIKGYWLSYGGLSIELPKEMILHLRDNNQNIDESIKGRSRLLALQDPISNIVAAYEARNVMITRKGAIGILSNTTRDVAGSMPIDPNDKENLQSDFQRYGLSKDQNQVIITNAQLKWQSMTFPTKEMMLFEEIEDDVRQITDNYGYPMYLLGFKSGTTFSNMKEAKTSLYQDTVIPESIRWAESFSTYFNTEKYGLKISITYDHLEIFQQSEKEKADAFGAKVTANTPLLEKNIITLNQFLTALDLETRPDGDKFLSDIQAMPLAVKLGVGGTTALQAILSDPAIPDNRKRNIMVIVFGMSEQDATQIMAV